MTSERVQKDRAYYQEFKISRLDMQPDIDVEWYFNRVDELERQLAEARDKLGAACGLYVSWYNGSANLGLDGASMAYELVSAIRQVLATLNAGKEARG